MVAKSTINSSESHCRTHQEWPKVLGYVWLIHRGIYLERSTSGQTQNGRRGSIERLE
jgi:hypothetical protein